MKKSNPHKSYPNKVEKYIKKTRKESEPKTSDSDKSWSKSNESNQPALWLIIENKELIIKDYQKVTKESLFNQIQIFS